MNSRRLRWLPGALASVGAGLLLPVLFPSDLGFAGLCVLLALQEILLLGLPALLAMRRSPASAQELQGLWGKPTAYQSGLGMLAAVSFTLVGVLITVVFVAALQSFGFGIPEGAALVPEGPGQLAAAILCVTLIPAAAEELLFRGLIQGALAKRFSGKAAVWVSAILFALLHRSVLAFPQILAIGLVLGVLRVRSGGLVLPIVFHAFYNFAVLVLNYTKAVPTLGMMLLCVGIFTVSFRLLNKQEVADES